MFHERIEVFGSVEFNKLSIVTWIIKIALKVSIRINWSIDQSILLLLYSPVSLSIVYSILSYLLLLYPSTCPIFLCIHSCIHFWPPSIHLSHLSIPPFIHLDHLYFTFHQSIHPSTLPSIRLFILHVYMFLLLSLLLHVQSVLYFNAHLQNISSSIYSSILPSPVVQLSIHLYIHTSVHPFLNSFIHSPIHSYSSHTLLSLGTCWVC